MSRMDMINKHGADFFCGKDMYEFCKEGRADLVQNATMYLQNGLRGAARGGHMDLVKFLLTKGAYVTTRELEEACAGGHMDIAQFFIEELKKTSERVRWNDCLLEAAKAGHFDLFKLITEHGDDNFNFNSALHEAMSNKHNDIVEYIILKYGNREYDVMCDCGHTTRERLDTGNLLWTAQLTNNTSLYKFLVKHGIKDRVGDSHKDSHDH